MWMTGKRLLAFSVIGVGICVFAVFKGFVLSDPTDWWSVTAGAVGIAGGGLLLSAYLRRSRS